jgi:hypothetical protein
MAELVEFFLKQANRDDLSDAGPPYLVNFKMARPNIEAARAKGEAARRGRGPAPSQWAARPLHQGGGPPPRNWCRDHAR